MFEKRLTWFWIALTGIALIIVGRLVQIQIVEAAEYERLAENMLTRPPDYVTAPRGTVYDRNQHPLLTDEPTFNVCIHYRLLTTREGVAEEYLSSVARALVRKDLYPDGTSWRDVLPKLRTEVAGMWSRLAKLIGIPEADVRARAARVGDRVDRVRAFVQSRSPQVRGIAEEDQLLPVLEGLDGATALPIRLKLEERPWLRVLPSSRRVAHDDDTLVHLLGRQGAVSPQRIADDPARDNELRGLRAGDQCGISGIERIGERVLRGTRGRIIEGYDRRVLERIEPVRGNDVYLTIDLDLQRDVLSYLRAAVEGDPDDDTARGLPKAHRSGAAAVVIDVATREVLALASYPTYPYATFTDDYDDLRHDKARDPLMFRAVRAQYPPGSICKAVTLIGGLTDGVVSPTTTFDCEGPLLPNRPNRFRCWIFRQYNMHHGPQNGEDAVRNSCNIYFYQVGGLLGAEQLCGWFEHFGMGQSQGTGLIEESRAIVPDEAWMSSPDRANPRRHRKADAWNFAIGQGEVTITPLQAANVGATVASGYWAPVRIATDDTGEPLSDLPARGEPFNAGFMKILRKGMYRVVNEQGGTAPRARIDHPDYVLCGKTGSAQSVQRVVRKRYTCEWPDGRREDIVAISKWDALARFGDNPPRVVDDRIVELFPRLGEDEAVPSHAWFMGYTQPKSTSDGATPHGKVYAIAVVVEYGDSGGRVAGPVAKRIAERVLGE